MPQSKNSLGGRPEQRENVDFLVDRFGIASPKAADLVTDDEREADALSSQKNAREHGKDDLAGTPVPEAPSEDHVADSDEEALKPVLRNRKS